MKIHTESLVVTLSPKMTIIYGKTTGRAVGAREGESSPWKIQGAFLAKMSFGVVEFGPVIFKEGCKGKEGWLTTVNRGTERRIRGASSSSFSWSRRTSRYIEQVYKKEAVGSKI